MSQTLFFHNSSGFASTYTIQCYREAGYTLDRSPAGHRAKTDIEWFTLTFTQINLAQLSEGREPKQP